MREATPLRGKFLLEVEKENAIEIMAAEAMAQKPERITVSFETEERSWRTLFRRRAAVSTKDFRLFRPTAAKVALSSALILRLEINAVRMKKNPIVEAMRVSAKHTPIVARIIALHTTADWEEVYDDAWLDRRAGLLARVLNMATMAALLEWVILVGDYIPFASALGSTLRVSDTVLKAKRDQSIKP